MKAKRKKYGTKLYIAVSGLLAVAVLSIMMQAAAWADQAEQEAAEAGVEMQPVEQQGEAGQNENVLPRPNVISVTFNEEQRDIRKALHLIGQAFGRDIIPQPNVEGEITFYRLRNVTLDEALSAILGEKGFKFNWEDDGKFIRVYTKEDFQALKNNPGRMVHRIITLYYITSEEAEKLITPLLSEHGSVKASTAAKIGITQSETGQVSEVGGNAMALHDTIVIYDFPENIERMEELIQKVDIRPMQVLIEATILSARITDRTELGVDWSAIDGLVVDSLETIGRTATQLSSTGFTNFQQGTGGMRVGIGRDNVRVLIHALESITDVSILANPKVLALNKQEGIVYIGDRLGYPDVTEQNQSGSTTQKINFLETGTRLAFRPYIADDGYIRMDIYPKSSTGTVDNAGIPTEQTTELSANIMVKDGQTIVMGGLFRDSINTSKSQVPVLGNIPFLGTAFRGTDDQTQRDEVIVMLTPHIIEDSAQTGAERAANDIARKMLGARDTLQWVHRDRLALDHYANAVGYYTGGDKVMALYELYEALLIRPAYSDALRLQERIVVESGLAKPEQLERIMLEQINKEKSDDWVNPVEWRF